jgi:hypothetical protein
VVYLFTFGVLLNWVCLSSPLMLERPRRPTRSRSSRHADSRFCSRRPSARRTNVAALALPAGHQLDGSWCGCCPGGSTVHGQLVWAQAAGRLSGGSTSHHDEYVSTARARTRRTNRAQRGGAGLGSVIDAIAVGGRGAAISAAGRRRSRHRTGRWQQRGQQVGLTLVKFARISAATASFATETPNETESVEFDEHHRLETQS